MTRILRGDHCQCSKCGEYFNSTFAFDKHRIGSHGKDRRCRTTEEMLAAGMAMSNGWWVSSAKASPSFAYNSRSGDQ